MEKQIKPCPFCGCIPEVNGDVVTHRHNGEICIVDDTQYDIEKWNKRADGWISVKDRLPEDLITVLVFCEDGISLSWYEYRNEEWFCDSVTHWMPLPEAPK